MSNTCADDFGGYGATAIDSLSTAIIFGNEDAVLQILKHVATVDFAVVKGGTEIQVFEVIIRHLAAMISAVDLLNGPASGMVKARELLGPLRKQMVTLGDALACAFDTPTGVPHDWVDPAACKAGQGTVSTVAGVGTVILEFGRLSNLTGDGKYVAMAHKAEQYPLAPTPTSGEPFPGLLGSYVSISDGAIFGSKGSWGAFADCKLTFRASMLLR